MQADPDKKLNRIHLGKLLGEAWGKSATANNVVSGFKLVGISPFNPAAIPV